MLCIYVLYEVVGFAEKTCWVESAPRKSWSSRSKKSMAWLYIYIYIYREREMYI